MPPKKIVTTSTATILRTNEFVYVQNKDTGAVAVHQGPRRVTLSGNESFISDIHQATVISERQYIIVLNYQGNMGSRKVIHGPCSYTLAYGESLEDGIVKEMCLLMPNEALLVESNCKTDTREAGERYLVQGPCQFVPSETENVLKQYETMQLGLNEGIYVKNVNTSQIRLVQGPCAYMLTAEEELHSISYAGTGMDVSLQTDLANRPFEFSALAVQLEEGEGIMVEDLENSRSRCILGPRSVVLNPSERVRTLRLSAGKPKVCNVLQISKLKIGPIPTSDLITVFTKDNAGLAILITYTFVFLVTEETAHKMFLLNDPIGHLCASVCSDIRELATKYTFEEFHNGTVSLISKAIFKHLANLTNPSEDPVPISEGPKGSANPKYASWTACRWFASNRMCLYGIDVKQVNPTSAEIGSLLSESIKSNMSIVCKKMEQQAQLELQKGRLAGQSQIAELRGQLIALQNENYRLETLERAKIQGLADVERAKYKSQGIAMQGELDSDIERQKIVRTVNILSANGGDRYIELERIRGLSKVRQNWVIPTSSSLNVLPH
eukprot:ANDGO_00780.mRNA.1 Major vault protein